MKRVSWLAVVGLCLCLSPLVFAGASADGVPVDPPAHKTPLFFHAMDEAGVPHREVDGRPGAFLEMTDVAP